MGADGLPPAIAAAIAEISKKAASATPQCPEPITAEQFLAADSDHVGH